MWLWFWGFVEWFACLFLVGVFGVFLFLFPFTVCWLLCIGGGDLCLCLCLVSCRLLFGAFCVVCCLWLFVCFVVLLLGLICCYLAVYWFVCSLCNCYVVCWSCLVC